MTTVTAIRSTKVWQNLGINTHIDFGGYATVAQIIQMVNFLGFKLIRDCPDNSSTVGTSTVTGTFKQVADGTGAKFCCYCTEGSVAAMQRDLPFMQQIATQGIVAYFEGGNEEDDQFAISNGNSLTAAKSFQSQVYAAGQAAGIPVINISFGAGWTPADNWSGDYNDVGDMSGVCDYGNAHTYPGVGQGTGWSMNRLTGLANMAAPGRPVIHTEFGWNQSQFPAADIQRFGLFSVFDSIVQGVPIFFYALIDDGSGLFGLMNKDTTPKLVGQALHDLHAILDDTGTGNPNPSFTYTTSGTTANDQILVMQKSNGNFLVAIWNESDAAHNVTITSSTGTVSQIKVYDATLGQTPISTSTGSNAVTVSIPNRPLVVEFVTSATPAPITIASLAMNPNTVVGSVANSIGTVALTGAAPTGGLVVTLASNNTHVTVPASITIPAGATSGTFTATTTAVSPAATVTLTATNGSTSKTATLTVNPVPPAAALSAVALSPSTIVGGAGSVTGTVTLDSPAPTGGAVVSLSSNNTHATVPSTVTVAAGSTAANFTVSTTSVTASAVATITATYSSVSKTATLALNVAPPVPALSSVTLNPTSIVGGAGSVTATVALDQPAPTGGAVISLSSNDAHAVIGASVTIPAGSSNATATITTSSVTSSETATITATYNSVSKTAALTLNPAPAAALTGISLSPTSIVGGSGSVTATVSLDIPAPTGGATVTLSSSDSHAVAPASVTIPAGSTNATATITTSSIGADATATITAVYSGVTKTAALTITAAPPVAVLSSLTVNPATLAGGTGSVLATITLNLPAPTGGAVISLSSNDTHATVPSTVTIPAGSTNTTAVISTTAVTAFDTATITATYNSVSKTASVNLTVAATLLSVTLDQTHLVGGSALVNAVVTLDNPAPTGGATVVLSSDNSNAVIGNSVTVIAGATTATTTISTATVTVDTPVTITAIYSGVTKTAPLTINPVPPAPVLSSLVANPTSLIGGSGSVDGIITLSDVAGSSGVLVTLSSSDSHATVPATATVDPGSNTVTFPITTTTVSVSTSVTITATYSGVTKTAALTLTPVPPAAALKAVSVTPVAVVGGTGLLGTITLTDVAPSGGAVVGLNSNNSAATVPATATVPALGDNVNFSVTTDPTIVTNQNVTITATYAAVSKTAALSVTSPSPAWAPVIAVPSTDGTIALSPGLNVGGLITISDPKAVGHAGSCGLTLTGTRGNLQVVDVTGTASVTGNGTTNVHVTASIDICNAILGTLVFKPTQVGAGKIHVTFFDQGGVSANADYFIDVV